MLRFAQRGADTLDARDGVEATVSDTRDVRDVGLDHKRYGDSSRCQAGRDQVFPIGYQQEQDQDSDAD